MHLLPIVVAPLEVLFNFLPFDLRKVQSRGVQLFDLYYWHPDLAPFIGEKDCREVRFDPRDISKVYVRGPDGLVRVCRCTNPDIREISLYELRESRRRRKAAADDPAQKALRHAGLEANDALVAKSVAATRSAHRQAAREEERQKAAKQTSVLNGIVPQETPRPADSVDLDPAAPIPDFVTEQLDLLTPDIGEGVSHADV